MSETDLNREPIELVEIVLPRCANTYGVSPCTATGTAGSECFNCRATCQDSANYRDRPDGGLTPSQVYAARQSIGTGELDETTSLFWALDVQLPNSITASVGGLFYYGQNTPGAIAFGTGFSGNSGKLVYGAKQGANEAVIVYDADAEGDGGKRLIFFGELEFVASGTSTIRLWAFDPIERTSKLIGSDTYTTGATWASASALGAVRLGSAAGDTANVVTVIPLADAIVYSFAPYAQAAPSNMVGGFGNNLWLGRGVKGEPTDEKYILPCLQDVGVVGTKINLSGADDDYRPLGRRATLDFTVSDFAHSDVTQDPYLSTRLYDPLERSTFWRKWLQRQKFGKVGARVRVYDGYAGQPLSAYLQRGYVMEDAKWREDGVAFYCRDELSRTEFLRAQVPAPSPGALALDITDAATSLTMSGQFTSIEYPETVAGGGTIRIDDEIMTYTTKSYDSGTDTTTLSGLTRGAEGTAAAEHSQNDRIQLCKIYAAATVEDVVRDLLLGVAEIPGQMVDQAGLASEQAAYLPSYSLSAVISEPTAVDTVLGWICREASVYIWWDERAQQVRIKAIRAVSAGDITETLTHEDNILANSMRLTEKPRQRLNVITFYYNPRDKAGDPNEVTNYANALQIVNGTTSEPEQYGNVIQTRSIFSRFLTTEAEVNQTGSRLSARYADVPVFAEFHVDAKDRSLWTGDIIKISHPTIVNGVGERDVRRWLIIEAEEVDPGHLVRYICADITLDGLIYTITEDGIGTYTPELFALGNVFITDNDGLNPDGSVGATIS